ncbi:hypothetical protein RFM98_19385 [Mesorhizobium sp. VK9D]|uniref:hypothetical protein n=1 Tax=Mesorhizobium australafricanum TaxID=3072311 RepID=UPI002A23A35C|nr:hypothetical protein [Mesorhizobium sp. VK9D]MDX8454931.1 hypothetical protein [Mesorhizobium sp. VK9D]
MRWQCAGILEPEDIEMLERVLRKMLPPNATADEREWLASLLVKAFQSGAADEAALVAKIADKSQSTLPAG